MDFISNNQIDGGPKVLEQYDEFKEFSDVSKKFLRFAANYLSNGNSDLTTILR
jgi:hypothetical protein